MNRRLLHRDLNVRPSPAPSAYASVSDEDLGVMIEQRVAKAFRLPVPQFSSPPPPDDLNALNALNAQASAIRRWAEGLSDKRVRKLALAAAEQREAQVREGLGKNLSSDGRQHVPPLPLIEVS